MPKNMKDKKSLKNQTNSKGQNPSITNDDLGENATHFEELYSVEEIKKKKDKKQ